MRPSQFGQFEGADFDNLRYLERIGGLQPRFRLSIIVLSQF